MTALSGHFPWSLSPVPLAALDPSLRVHGLLERCSNPRRLSQQGQEAPRKPRGKIQIPHLLILRTSHHWKEEETTRLSISTHTTPSPFPSTTVDSQGWRVCSYIYPQVSGMAGLCDTMVNSTPSVAITRKLSHNCDLLTHSAPPQHTSPLLSQVQEVSPRGCLGSGRMPILVDTTYGRAPKSRAPVSPLPHTSELPVPVVCGKFSSEQRFTATKADFDQQCLVNTSSTLLPGRLQGQTHPCIFPSTYSVFFQRAQMLCVANNIIIPHSVDREIMLALGNV